MTIITKPLSENKAKKQKEPLFLEETADGISKSDVEAGIEPRFVILGEKTHKLSVATTICLFLTALLVMSVGVIGGMYLYRQFTRAQLHFHGWCSIPYNIHPNPSRQELISSDVEFEKFDVIDNHRFFRNSFQQGFDIDLENENVEKIMVPDFKEGRKGIFIHDFATNKTAIIDVKKNRCFVMPLNRERVLPPVSMYDLAKKISLGVYDIDTEAVRETMRVVIPPITDFKGIGRFITKDCKDRKTYMLVKDDEHGISKRSTPTSEVVFAEFAGKKISEFYIDTSALDEFEKEAEQV